MTDEQYKSCQEALNELIKTEVDTLYHNRALRGRIEKARTLLGNVVYLEREKRNNIQPCLHGFYGVACKICL